MKNLSKKISGFLLILGTLMVVSMFNSCQSEEEDAILDDQSMYAKDPITNLTPNSDPTKSDCDCDLILQADINGNGDVSTIDLVLLEQIYTFLDFDGDGCAEYINGTLTADVLGWVNSGTGVPSMLYDYDGNGVVDGLDVREAYYLAEQFGAISGDHKLCSDDIECIRKYVLGVISCD